MYLTNSKFITKRSIFLIDGCGAAVSTLVTGFVLPHFSQLLGLSPKTLHLLACLPFVYFFFSLGCFLLGKAITPWMLISIIIANFGYCAITTTLIVLNDDITGLGILLLTLENFVIMMLIALEIQIYRRESPHQ